MPLSSVAVHVRVITSVSPIPGTDESLSVIVTVPHVSVPVATPVAAELVSPVHSTVTSTGISISGIIESSTVTVAGAELELPFTFITVNVTVLSPILLQVKTVGSTAIKSIPQVSLLPASISDPSARIIALPSTSSCTVKICVRTTGTKLFSTVTTAVVVLTLPLLSITVSVTVLSPT